MWPSVITIALSCALPAWADEAEAGRVEDIRRYLPDLTEPGEHAVDAVVIPAGLAAEEYRRRHQGHGDPLRFLLALYDSQRPPDPQVAAELLMRAAGLAHGQCAGGDEARCEQADRLYSGLLTTYPDYARRDVALMGYAWFREQEGLTLEARPLWERLLLDHPDSPWAPVARQRLRAGEGDGG